MINRCCQSNCRKPNYNLLKHGLRGPEVDVFYLYCSLFSSNIDWTNQIIKIDLTPKMLTLHSLEIDSSAFIDVMIVLNNINTYSTQILIW